MIPLDSSLGKLHWLTLIGKQEEQHRSSEGQNATALAIDLSDESADTTEEPVIESSLIEQNSKISSKEENNISFSSDGKPNLSYAELIRRAIDSSSAKRMTLNEIYHWITNNFPFYRQQEKNQSWKNSIRHNLSLNKLFVREQRDRGEPGKGSYWRVDDKANNHWARNRRNICSAAYPSKRLPSCSSSNTSPTNNNNIGHSVPRVNPVIERMYGSPKNIQQTQAQNEQQQFFTAQSNIIDLNRSHNSTCGSWQNSQLFRLSSTAELDNTAELSASFRNLYQQVFNSSFNGNSSIVNNNTCYALQLPQFSNSCSLASSTGVRQEINYSNANYSDAQMLTPTCASTAPTATSDSRFWHHQQQQQQQQYNHQNGFPCNSNSNCFQPPTETPQEMLKSLDMHQFQAMMGSMSSRDVQQWLADCTSELAMSWREFLKGSIHVNNDLHLQDNQPLPPNAHMDSGVHRRQQSASSSSPSEREIDLHNAPTPAALDGSPSSPLHLDSMTVTDTTAQSMDTNTTATAESPIYSQQIATMAQMHPMGHGQLVKLEKEDHQSPTAKEIVALYNPVLSSIRRPSHDLTVRSQQMGATSIKEEESEDEFDWEGLINKD